MEWLWYSLILILVGAVVYGGTWVVNKYKLKKNDLASIYMMMNTINFIISKFNLRFKNEIGTIITYCFEVITLVENSFDIEDRDVKLTLIKEKTLEICGKNGIVVDEDLINLIDKAIEFIYTKSNN
jgi:hypothetical protein